MKAFFINGVFFQQYQSMGIGYKAGDGATVMVREGIFDFLHHGLIYPNPETFGSDDGYLGYLGTMIDHFGRSNLRDIIVNENQLVFTKCYEQGDAPIIYRFDKKDGNTWVGTFDGVAVGEGISRCIVTEIGHSEFFDIQGLMELLGKSIPHKLPHSGCE